MLEKAHQRLGKKLTTEEIRIGLERLDDGGEVDDVLENVVRWCEGGSKTKFH